MTPSVLDKKEMKTPSASVLIRLRKECKSGLQEKDKREMRKEGDRADNVEEKRCRSALSSNDSTTVALQSSFIKLRSEIQMHVLSSAIEDEGKKGQIELIWAHGWGQSSAAFSSLLPRFAQIWTSSAVDFPGFGRSSPPPLTWGTQDYAEALLPWLKSKYAAGHPLVWIGHSFGARVGVRLAASFPELLTGLVLVAGAGLPSPRSLRQRLLLWSKIRAFKLAKQWVPEGPKREALRHFFGSSDYKNAGVLRPVFLRVIQEDLTSHAQRVRCPTLLLYGDRDMETPPEIGKRYARLIPNARSIVLEGYDHYSLLQAGQHHLSREIGQFVRGLFPCNPR